MHSNTPQHQSLSHLVGLRGLETNSDGALSALDHMRSNPAVTSLFVGDCSQLTDVVGFHGTSIQALRKVVETGSLLGHSCEKGDFPQGTLYFFDAQYETSLVNSRLWSCRTARRHQMLESLNIPIQQASSFHERCAVDVFWTDLDYVELDEELIKHNPCTQSLMELGFTLDQIVNAAYSSVNAQGVVFALHSAVNSNFDLYGGDEDDEVEFIAPGGLDLRFLSGIEVPPYLRAEA
jgi:hypothetical protein